MSPSNVIPLLSCTAAVTILPDALVALITSSSLVLNAAIAFASGSINFSTGDTISALPPSATRIVLPPGVAGITPPFLNHGY